MNNATQNHTAPKLILGSSSSARRSQMIALGLKHQAVSPNFDEFRLPDEPPHEMALRLAKGKAWSLKNAHPNNLIIGCDQVADCAGHILGKPGSLEKAHDMLALTSGQFIDFYSAIVLLNTHSGYLQSDIVRTRVKMRDLSSATIEHYLQSEPQAIHCAGGVKSEGKGALLLQVVSSDDPSALVGLPVIRLTDFLMNESYFLW